jgi:hypothetical protein
MNNVTVNTLIQKYEASAGEIARAFGPFSLFGLFEREDNPGKLDLIVAAPWLKTDRGGLLKIASYLPHLTAEEGALIGRIVALEPDTEFVQGMNRMIQDHAGRALEIGSASMWGTDISHGYVIASQSQIFQLAVRQAALG